MKGASDDLSAATYRIYVESHTMGNALRWMLMKNPKVEFCGYRYALISLLRRFSNLVSLPIFSTFLPLFILRRLQLTCSLSYSLLFVLSASAIFQWKRGTGG
ncbi:hypothetical protein SCHPADRAFT_616408 [Schizopora paradoxa]|uniref:DNA-directed RNA polymerase RBP11-like dimerisation domain-containing protein n=1 Tax=Schizopora paradoxa TaxID=27342 RepID=A0A0H2R8S7_9AGAM|nr:hypothetical protein SCHPADRAFT_616408 [Schizopora paradoxa]